MEKFHCLCHLPHSPTVRKWFWSIKSTISVSLESWHIYSLRSYSSHAGLICWVDVKTVLCTEISASVRLKGSFGSTVKPYRFFCLALRVNAARVLWSVFWLSCWLCCSVIVLYNPDMKWKKKNLTLTYKTQPNIWRRYMQRCFKEESHLLASDVFFLKCLSLFKLFMNLLSPL